MIWEKKEGTVLQSVRYFCKWPHSLGVKCNNGVSVYVLVLAFMDHVIYMYQI